ncbi:YgjV family protein [Maribacter sp. MMG018]|uniref:YgjV family protein n=1 Tax=Maribacter TaxID=252356 RepID=UPI0006417C9F|nr:MULTISPECIES: YgjV family protein [Maribacter]MBQ4915040.1 YgjV family protein [Maribacter sp. MMG018]
MNLYAEILGYIAIMAGFYAVTKKDMGGFRLWHMISSFFYVIYGVFLVSGPLIISGAIFCVIHMYHLRKLKQQQKQNNLDNHTNCSSC